jgi:chromosomal replication initiation ATPase DnaA
MPAIIRGEVEPITRVYGIEGTLQDHWDRPSIIRLKLPRCNDILRAVSDASLVHEDEIMGDRRDRYVARPRQVLCYLIRELRPRLGIVQVGKFMNRDHSTITHAVKTIHGLLDRGEEDVVQIYRDAKRELGV